MKLFLPLDKEAPAAAPAPLSPDEKEVTISTNSPEEVRKRKKMLDRTLKNQG